MGVQNPDANLQKNKIKRIRNEKREAMKIKQRIMTKYRNRNGYSSFLFL